LTGKQTTSGLSEKRALSLGYFVVEAAAKWRDEGQISERKKGRQSLFLIMEKSISTFSIKILLIVGYYSYLYMCLCDLAK